MGKRLARRRPTPTVSRRCESAVTRVVHRRQAMSLRVREEGEPYPVHVDRPVNGVVSDLP